MRIQYCYSMLEGIDDRANIELVEIPLDRVPENIMEIIENHEAFSAPGVFGEQGLGSPEEYEKLIFSDDNGCRTFEYFNRGIYYMMSGNEKERPGFQVFTHFMLMTRDDHV